MAKRNGGDSSEQVEILRAIWTEMKALNGRVERTNERLDAVRLELKAEIGELRHDLRDEIDQLRRRVVESEVRLATATTQLAGDVQTLSGLIREWREEHRQDRADLRHRVERLETQAGIGR